MNEKLQKFFIKHHIEEQDVMYIFRQNQKSMIQLNDGRTISTYTPAKTIVEDFDKNTFLNINKGIFLNIDYILYVDHENYTMKDCKEFCGRTRSNPDQKTMKTKLVKNISYAEIHSIIKSKFNILDKCPIPFCIFEQDTKANKFIIRYINNATKQINSRFQLGKNMLSAFPLTKEQIQIVHDLLTQESQAMLETDRYKIYCYVPLKNYCAFLFFKK